jgi:ABC-2 type transport system permease protein
MPVESLAVPRAPDVVTRTIVTKSLWEARRSLVGWTLSVSAVATMYAAFWPTINTPQMQQAMASYPKALLEAMNYTDLTSAAGYVGSAVYGLLVAALVTVFTIAKGARAVAGEEEEGLLDLLLAHPVGRGQVALQRFAALVVEMVVIAVVLWLAMVAISGPAKLEGITAGNYAAACLQLTLFGLAIGSVAFAVGAATGKRGWAVSTASAVAVLGYLANGVFPQFEPLSWTRDVTPWNWYLGGAPLRHGLQVADCGLLLAMTVVFVTAGTWVFTRRDVGV